MANFEARTASSGARIKAGKEEEVSHLFDRYVFPGDLTIETYGGVLEVYGYEWPYAEKVSEDGSVDPEQEDCFEDFLQALAPLLEEELVINCIGGEKCRFPLSAMEIKVTPDGEVQYGGFKF